MAALRASLTDEAAKPQDKISVKKSRAATAMDKKRAEGQRDMLLPISGAKGSKIVWKPVASPGPAIKPRSVVRKAS